MSGRRKTMHLSHLEDMESDDEGGDVPIYVGGSVTSTSKRSQKVAVENRSLLNSLVEGRRYIGEYHAQLALDNITLSELMRTREAEMKAEKKKEKKMDARLDFLFQDCKRLSLDNEEIVKQGKKMDEDLAELYSHLELQESKMRSTKRELKTEQEKHNTLLVGKGRAHENYYGAREKLVKQHQSLWMLQDTVEYLKVEVSHLQKVLQSAEDSKKLDSLQAAVGGSGGVSPSSGGVSPSNASPGGGGEAGVDVVTTPQHKGGGGQMQASGEECTRRDCRELRTQVKELGDDIQQLARDQKQRQMDRAEALRLNRSLGTDSLLPTARSRMAMQGSVQGTPTNSTSQNPLTLTPSSIPIVASPSIRGVKEGRHQKTSFPGLPY